MSEKGSVFQKGGGGTNFEQSVQTAFVTTLIIRGVAPCLPSNEVTEVAFQNTNKGYQTDDLLVSAKSSIGQHRLVIQIKHNIAFTVENRIFREVIEAFWKDYNNPKVFDKEKDKLIVIKSGLTNDERNHLKPLFNWSNTHATASDFITEVNRIKAKNDRLEVFQTVLKELNGNIALTDEQIWSFIKCVDLLGYDFLNQGSIDESYFLNLIRLSKNEQTQLNEKEIWSSILSYVTSLNKDGGNATTRSIQKEELYKNFNNKKLNPHFKGVEKLRNDSSVLIKSLKNSISGFHLDRIETDELIANAVNNFQFTIVTGKPGTGKSVEIKGVIEKYFLSANSFVFRADQFNQPHIANVFSNQGVNEPIQDIFTCISLIPVKIIFIDSLEKLLEADPECAFKQILSVLKELPDIKLICSSRNYAVDLIIQKFGIDKNNLGIVEVLPFDDFELSKVEANFPELKNLLENKKIKKLLESPKYLDFALLSIRKSGDDYSNASLKEFKNQLWNSLVKDFTKRSNGLPGKREDAFMEIALKRAREMKLFTTPLNSDQGAIDLLEHDEIIFQDNSNRKYSPSHDILEDWALLRHISMNFSETAIPNIFFRRLGNEPAIRRAFRLWIEDSLIDDDKNTNQFIKATLKDLSVERYWADEILVAVFRSDNCKSFFVDFEKDLLMDNSKFLNRCLHLVKTCCKETDSKSSKLSFPLPFGSGWKESVLFISKHVPHLDEMRLSICSFLSDWNYRLIFQYLLIEKEELIAAKSIILHYFNQVDLNDEFWQTEFISSKLNELVSILYGLTSVAVTEITNLVEKALINLEDRNSWRFNSFYETVVNKCLSGVGNQYLINELPELIIQTAWKAWKLPEKESADDLEGLWKYSSLRHEECWGVKDKFRFMSSGIYKTPIYNLLGFHPLLALDFIVEFLNYSVDFYIKADCEYKRNFNQVEIHLNNGTTVLQWASWELWVAYRGLSVTHYAIECILMSLEKYLLETAMLRNEVSKSNLQFIFNYILCKSNNIATSGVLASVAIAYPEEVGESLLPLLSVEEFYDWDQSRALQESSAFALYDKEIPFAQKERLESNQLPHRKRFTSGLGDFVIDYQFNIRTLNKEIHKLFDKLKSRAEIRGVIWKKRLAEIDIRTWEVKFDDNMPGRAIVQPTYEENVHEFLNSNKAYFDNQSLLIRYANIIREAYEEKSAMHFNTWQKCFFLYTKNLYLDLLYCLPVSLAIIGLRDFKDQLSDRQKRWCYQTIKRTIGAVLESTYQIYSEWKGSFNLMEKEIAITSFHFLLANVEKEDDKSGLVSLMLSVLSGQFADGEIDKIINYFRTILFQLYPTEAKRVWICLIKYSHFKKNGTHSFYNYNEENIHKEKEKEVDFVNSISASGDLNFDLSEINFEVFEAYLITRAFVIIPYNTTDKNFADFINVFIPLLIQDLKIDGRYRFGEEREERQIPHAESFDAEIYISELLLFSDTLIGNEIFDLLYNALSECKGQNHIPRELHEFVSGVVKFFTLKIYDDTNNNIDNLESNTYVQKFWKFWKHFSEKVKASNKTILLSDLFLNIEYLISNGQDEVKKPWEVLRYDNGLFNDMINDFSNYDIERYLINVYATIGDVFLPQGLNKLVDILKQSNSSYTALVGTSAELLIKRLFYHHIIVIKKDQSLIANYIWLLNKMVDIGSSEAYLFRENVITYKAT